MNVSRVRVPSRPMVLRSVAPATPVITSETTRGITVIRIALTQMVPIGVSQSAAPSSAGLPLAAMARAAGQAGRQGDEHAGAVGHGSPHIMRSPPLMSSDAPVM